MYILGISAFYHDSAACLIFKSEIIAAAQEERFTRKKHDESFPINAINFCLKQANINAKDINKVVFYEKPFLKFERLIETYLAIAPFGFLSFTKAIPIWVKNKLFQTVWTVLCSCKVIRVFKHIFKIRKLVYCNCSRTEMSKIIYILIF